MLSEPKASYNEWCCHLVAHHWKSTEPASKKSHPKFFSFHSRKLVIRNSVWYIFKGLVAMVMHIVQLKGSVFSNLLFAQICEGTRRPRAIWLTRLLRLSPEPGSVQTFLNYFHIQFAYWQITVIWHGTEAKAKAFYSRGEERTYLSLQTENILY